MRIWLIYQPFRMTFPFYAQLRDFYVRIVVSIRQHYRELTRKYLDFNSPSNANAFLRQPQFEALEMYIFLKEFLDNKPVHQLFKEWSEQTEQFSGRSFVAQETALARLDNSACSRNQQRNCLSWSIVK